MQPSGCTSGLPFQDDEPVAGGTFPSANHAQDLSARHYVRRSAPTAAAAAAERLHHRAPAPAAAAVVAAPGSSAAGCGRLGAPAESADTCTAALARVAADFLARSWNAAVASGAFGAAPAAAAAAAVARTAGAVAVAAVAGIDTAAVAARAGPVSVCAALPAA